MRTCPECGLGFTPSDAYCPEDGSPLIDNEDPLVGSTIGRYRVVRVLGEGGMGRVYLGLNPVIGARVAIKVLMHLAAANQEMVGRFFAEAQSVNTIRHEGIVNVIDLNYLDDGRPYIIMELLPGEPLSDKIRKGPLSLYSAASIVLEILSALDAAHAAGVVHRDLKPDNIFISPSGHAKLLDFGIAKLMPNYQASLIGPTTNSGALLGTPSYMAPEQVTGDPIVPATDLYAVGAILYETVTGIVAFKGDTLYGLFQRIVSDPPAPPSQYRAELMGPFQDLILQALAKTPQQRPASAASMAQMLASVRNQLPENLSATPSSLTAQSTGSGATLSVDMVRPKSLASPPQALSPPQMVELVQQQQPISNPGATPMHRPAVESHTAADTHRSSLFTKLLLPVLLVSLAAGMFFFLRSNDSSEHANTTSARRPAALHQTPSQIAADAQHLKAAEGSGIVLIEEKDPSTPSPANYDVKAFDATAHLAIARSLASRLYADAFLVDIDTPGVLPSGLIDLSLPGDLEVTYRFLSPSHSKRTQPIGVEDERPCWIYVEFNQTQFSARILDWSTCKGDSYPDPSCSYKQVWDKAIAKGATTKNTVASINYLYGDWFFDIPGGDFSESIEDDCKSQ